MKKSKGIIIGGAIAIAVVLLVCVLALGNNKESADNAKSADNVESANKTESNERAVDGYFETEMAGIVFTCPDYFVKDDSSSETTLICYAENDENLAMLNISDDTDFAMVSTEQDFYRHAENSMEYSSKDSGSYKTLQTSGPEKSETANGIKMVSYFDEKEYTKDDGSVVPFRHHYYFLYRPDHSVASVTYTHTEETEYQYLDVVEKMINECKYAD